MTSITAGQATSFGANRLTFGLLVPAAMVALAAGAWALTRRDA